MVSICFYMNQSGKKVSIVIRCLLLLSLSYLYWLVGGQALVACRLQYHPVIVGLGSLALFVERQAIVQ